MILKLLAVLLFIIFLISLKNKYSTQKIVKPTNNVEIKPYECIFPTGFDNTLADPYYEDHDVIELPSINPCKESFVPLGNECIKACRTCKMGMCEDGLCHN